MTSALHKVGTGVAGLDEIMHGGVPAGRLTLLSGGPGSGKTVLGVQFLCHGATVCDEPGLMVSFEETPAELATNMQSVGIDMDALIAQGRLRVVHVDIGEPHERSTGAFNLDGLFVRLEHAIAEIGARRLVVDALGTFVSLLDDERVVRRELVRLTRFLKHLSITTVMTAELDPDAPVRHGIEDHAADCTILLDHRVSEEISTRRLRIVKYRGSPHGTDEYPFLIGGRGLRLIPGTEPPPRQGNGDRLSVGSADIDRLLGGEGLYRGASAMISGAAGSGKTLLCSHYAAAACRGSERVLFIGFEESALELKRNAALTGADLDEAERRGQLIIEVTSPTRLGLESHLARMYELVESHEPSVVVVDPISALHRAGSSRDTNRLLLRLMGHLKASGISSMYAMTVEEVSPRLAAHVASAMDAWLQLGLESQDGSRLRSLRVTKARGASHSHGSHAIEITGDGFRLPSVRAA